MYFVISSVEELYIFNMTILLIITVTKNFF